MKHTLLAIALASAGIAAVPTLSHAADPGFFVNGAIGRSDFKKSIFDDHDTGYYANFGYRWAVAPSALIGIEGGYTDLGKFDSRPIPLPDGSTATATAKMKGWTLGANGHFNITPEWYISARGGFARTDLSARGLAPFDSPNRGGTGNGWYAGAGFGYDFAKNMSVGLNYDHYEGKKSGFKGDANLLSVGAEVRF